MEAPQLLKKAPNPRIPKFSAGDTVKVNFRIREGERERIQVFQGVVIRLQNGKGPAANFTVRRITAGIGIERIFPLHSPLVESLEVTRYGNVRRAKLYYLRGLQGRAARIKELNPVQRRKVQEEAAAAEAELAEQIAAATEAAEELEVEELGEESEEQPTEELDDAPVEEASEEPADEPAEEPLAEATEEEPAEEPAEESAEEGPAEETPPEESEAEAPPAEEPEEKPEEE
ncbi:MAG: 50S ribosomal protein L19 [Chloroflexi bacterium]|nr:50S ribosomal protein L19 [Chloroflexota bacterium]MCI0849192.1 50S ribosomal protein L19 [Chloroflexota bacterium]MCI0899818.1 50S ribosomal protein L19 [Chloroflexota bacterium]MCI0903121.1 50S ribosomal protein L19 [Chloroflexota bacterium]